MESRSVSLSLRGMYIVISAFLIKISSDHFKSKSQDSDVWMILLMVPAVLTLLIAFKLDFADRTLVKSISSFYLGCAMCFFFWLVVHLIVGFVRIQETEPILVGNVYAFDLRQSVWKCTMMSGVILWVKFLRSSSKQLLENKKKIKTSSPQEMLKFLAYLFLLLPVILYVIYQRASI